MRLCGHGRKERSHRPAARTAAHGILSDEWEPPAPTDSAGEYAYLVSLVRALPEGYRRVLELKLVEEQSNQEIARRLGLNESTVATRIQRGKAMLRERLKKEGYCYE